jgi:polyhydroxybutyrate depolymerase
MPRMTRSKEEKIMATRVTIILLLVLLALQCSNHVNAQTSTHDVEGSVSVDGVLRTYLLHVPPNAKNPMPLVLVLHGGGGRASGISHISGMDSVSDKHGFVVAYPQGFSTVFNDGGSDLAARDPHDDVKFVGQLIKDVAKQAPIDENRVFACGFSNGGMMSLRLAIDTPEVLKAVAMVGSGLFVKQVQEHPNPKPMPVLFIQGTDDPCFPYRGGETQGPNLGGNFRGRSHGKAISNDQDLAFWCRINHCDQKPQIVKLPHITKDDTSTTYTRFAGADGKDVVAYIISGGGHCWPGGLQYFPISVIGRTTYDFSASEAIWRFFAEHGGKQ